MAPILYYPGSHEDKWPRLYVSVLLCFNHNSLLPKGPILWAETDLLPESDILKMDIEYAEFASLTSLDQAFPEDENFELPIGQLMVELHLFGHEEMTGYNFLKWYVLFAFKLRYIYAFLENQ